MYKRFILPFFLLVCLAISTIPVQAQEADGPVYIVQPGDSLSSIAARFSVSLQDLMSANQITNPNLLAAGQHLVIPGLAGVTGTLSTDVINFGDSYRSLSRQTQIPDDLFKKLNHIVSPSEFYVGATMIIPDQGERQYNKAVAPAVGESLLELAVKNNTDVWSLADINGLQGSWDGLPGDTLFTSGENNGTVVGGLPSAFLSAEIRDLPLKQGGTAVIKIKTAPDVILQGSFVDHDLHFFQSDDGNHVALQGIHALLSPGIYPLQIEASLPDGNKQAFEQSILVVSGNYSKESLVVSTELIDPTVTGPEDEKVAGITAPTSPNKLWQDIFRLPVYAPENELPCIYDRYGTRRSFNGSAYDYFHSGMDYGVCFAENPFDIYAAAPGIVVFTGQLTVRGNATFIDHGWGVYTAYYHQKEILVSVGQQVQAGELIGQIGATGRVTGPHLHFEVWAGGVQVDPVDWLNQAYP